MAAEMRITRRQLRRIIREAHGGASGPFSGRYARSTAGATPTGPMTPEEQQRVFDMLVDSGSDPGDLKATGEYSDVDSMSTGVARRYLNRKYAGQFSRADDPDTDADDAAELRDLADDLEDVGKD